MHGEAGVRRLRYVRPGPRKNAALASQADSLGAHVLGTPCLGSIVEIEATRAQASTPVGARVFDKQPAASAIKALLVNSEIPCPFSGSGDDLERMNQGWETPRARRTVEWAPSGLLDDEETALLEGGTRSRRSPQTGRGWRGS